MAAGPYWRPRYYYDPMLLEAECGASISRESAVAALYALSRELSVSLGGVALVVAFLVFFGFASISMFGTIGFIGGFFALVPLVFLAFALGLALLVAWRASRLRRASRALRELAMMVQNGLVRPEEVCGKNVATLLELYRLKTGAGTPIPGQVPG